MSRRARVLCRDRRPPRRRRSATRGPRNGPHQPTSSTHSSTLTSFQPRKHCDPAVPAAARDVMPLGAGPPAPVGARGILGFSSSARWKGGPRWVTLRVLVREVRRAGRGVPVAIEATCGWYWAVDALQAAGCQVHLAHPYGMTAMRKRKRVKTDAKDAYELANLLRLGSLPEAYIAPPELRELRELVRHRQRLTQANTAVKAGIRGVLAKHNIHLPVSDLESA
ncbi:MAG TPA: transposase, partial [Actinomycetes bacterium]